MLFKFKSKVTSDLIMLEPDARRLLGIMLGDDPTKGIIVVQDLPNVIDLLEKAVAQDEAARQQRLEAAQNPAPNAEPAADAAEHAQALNPVRLSQRASPMLKLLKRCWSDKADVVWGV